MHGWSISITSEPTLQSRSSQHQSGLHVVLHLSSAPESSGRGRASTQNPIHIGWRKAQAQLSLNTKEMFNLSHLPLVTGTEVGKVGRVVTACSCPWNRASSHNTDTSPELCPGAEVRVILSIF